MNGGWTFSGIFDHESSRKVRCRARGAVQGGGLPQVTGGQLETVSYAGDLDARDALPDLFGPPDLARGAQPSQQTAKLA
jgi:hypothetical protein